MTARLIAAAALVGVMVAAGCSGKAKGQAGGSTINVSSAAQAKYNDPLAASDLRERALDALAVLAGDANPQLRANALEAMETTPGRLAEFIPRALRDENPGVRAAAAMLIGKAELRNLAPAARPLLNDPSAYVRGSAIFALTKCGIEVDPSPLAGMLLRDPSPRVRAQAAYLLGEIGDPSALGPLHDAAKATVPRASQAEMKMLQLQIAEAIVKLGEEDQISTIRAALYPARPEDLEITALAVQILGQLRDKAAADELIFLTAREDQRGQHWPAEIRLGCAAALARMGQTQGTFVADEFAGNPNPALRSQAAFTYGEIARPENLPKLETLLDDREGIVRVAAAASILKMTANPGSR